MKNKKKPLRRSSSSCQKRCDHADDPACTIGIWIIKKFADSFGEFFMAPAAWAGKRGEGSHVSIWHAAAFPLGLH